MLLHRVNNTALARGALLCLCVMSVCDVVGAQETHTEYNPAVNVEQIRDGELGAAIDRAVRGAQRRLQRGECARVFDDFSDGDGRLLSAVLATMAWSQTDPASRAIFRDGREHVRCRTAPVAAFTGPGSRVVFVCGNRFGKIGRGRAELTIIHELLHTVGLSERPPTPGEIDRVVARRCGP
jgi:hypothetical protein